MWPSSAAENTGFGKVDVVGILDNDNFSGIVGSKSLKHSNESER